MSWITTIANGIEKVFNATRPALKFIPAIFLICEVKNRPGLSAIALTAAVIKRLAEAGIDSGVNPDGTPNKTNKFIRIFAEEMIKEFKDNASISCALEPGTINMFGVGGNAGGPVTISGYNTLPLTIKGLLQ